MTEPKSRKLSDTPIGDKAESESQKPQAVEPQEKQADDSAEATEDQHAGWEPSEADYEAAKSGAGNEPELPPGVVKRK